MTNEYYNHSTWPATSSTGSSAPARAELDAVTVGFSLLPPLAGKAGTFVVVNAGASALTNSAILTESGGVVNASANIVGLSFIVGGDVITAGARTGFSGTGNGPAIAYYGNSHANAGRVDIITSGAAAEVQFSVTRVAGATRYVIAAGSVAGNPTLTASAGTLTVTGALVGNVTGNLTGNVTGNTSGTATTVTAGAQPSITSLSVGVTDSNKELGYKGLPAASVTTGAFGAADKGKCVYATAGVTIPNATMSAEDVVTIINTTGGAITLTATVATLNLAGTASTGNRTLAQKGIATVIFGSATQAYISGSGLT